jgi:hypothetical protein
MTEGLVNWSSTDPGIFVAVKFHWELLGRDELVGWWSG